MDVTAIIEQIDNQMAKLQAAREALVKLVDSGGLKDVVIRPVKKAAEGARKKRVMSEEGRQRIVEAQKRRWAARQGSNEPVQ